MSSKKERYWVEIPVQVGPDGYDWKLEDFFSSLKTAINFAKNLIRPTEHGDSAVRVWDTKKEKIVFKNF